MNPCRIWSKIKSNLRRGRITGSADTPVTPDNRDRFSRQTGASGRKARVRIAMFLLWEATKLPHQSTRPPHEGRVQRSLWIFGFIRGILKSGCVPEKTELLQERTPQYL